MTKVTVFDLVLAMAGFIGSVVVWLCYPEHWEVPVCLAFCFLGCIILSSLELQKAARYRSG